MNCSVNADLISETYTSADKTTAVAEYDDEASGATEQANHHQEPMNLQHSRLITVNIANILNDISSQNKTVKANTRQPLRLLRVCFHLHYFKFEKLLKAFAGSDIQYQMFTHPVNQPRYP